MSVGDPILSLDPVSPMSTTTDTLSAEQFAKDFTRTSELILEEWPELGVEKLEATGGDLEKVIAAVSDAVGKTKVTVRRQLAELHQLAQQSAGDDGVVARELRRLREMVERLESRTQDLADLPKEARQKVEENLWTSLLVALGLGFLLGLLTRGGGR
jgi:ElaB/YqjD/DUF883 family membrane-anchored ribosome-binding protein